VATVVLSAGVLIEGSHVEVQYSEMLQYIWQWRTSRSMRLPSGSFRRGYPILAHHEHKCFSAHSKRHSTWHKSIPKHSISE